MMKTTPCEARATMLALREGLSAEQFVDEMWRRRVAEHPCQPKSKGKWPALVYSRPDNVTVLSAKRGAKK